MNSVNGSLYDDAISGSSANDSLSGNAGNDLIEGRGGNDSLNGGRGNDTIVGGDGFDGSNYGTDPAITGGIVVDLAAGVVTGDPSLGTDSLQSIESIFATNFADTFVATGFGLAGAVNVGSSGTSNTFQGLGGDDTITGNGNTQISYISATAGVSVDLALGTATGNASVGTDTILGGVTRVQGSNFNDTIQGDGTNNSLNGQSGNDRLDGRGGNDSLNGGQGADTFVYASGFDAIQDFNRGQGDKIDLTGVLGVYSLADVLAITLDFPSAVIDFGGGNQLTVGGASKASLLASDFIFAIAGDETDNTVVGTAGSDVILGLDGDDVLEGLAGDDVLDGGDDRDLATYINATGAISVDMAAGTVSGDASVGNDTLISVENVRGSAFADTYEATGYAGNINPPSAITLNTFEGMGGDDIVIGNGGTQVSYESAVAGVTVDLTLATAGVPGSTGTGRSTTAGDAAEVGTDTFFGGVNRIRGSSFDDVLLGGNGPNESFNGGAGDDFIDGRGTFDTAIYTPLRNSDVTGGITVAMAAGTVTGDASVGTDTLRSIESVRGTVFDDIYNATGYGQVGALNVSDSNGVFNTFEGMDGNDQITGNGSTTIAFFNARAGVTADLLAGTAQGIDAGDIAEIGVDTIVSGVIQLGGSDHADIFYGSNNNLPGTGESFDGRGGNDTLDGRGGVDRAVYSIDVTVTGGIHVNMAAGVVTGDNSIGTDTLRRIEGVVGTNFTDTYDATGFALPGALNVGDIGTTNEFEGMGGNDTIIGSGDTRIVFGRATGAVTVNLALGVATGNASVGSDTITGGVTRVRGSNFDDIIVGNSANNTLEGQNGNDRIDGGDGNDALTGGAGADTFVYTSGADSIQDFNRTQGDKIDLTGMLGVYSLADVLALTNTNPSAVITFGPGNTLTLNGVTKASLVADDFLFAIAGDETDNTLVGTAGNDVIRGQDGDDVLEGLAGDDVLDGGPGRDLATYAGATGAISVDMAAGTVSGDASVGSDTFISIDNIRGTNFADTFVATGYAGSDNPPSPATSNGFEGMGGDDIVVGNGNTQVSYQTALAGVRVDLATPGLAFGSTGTASSLAGGDAAGIGTDTFFGGVNRVRGSAYADEFYGGAASDSFQGGAGNDVLVGGGGNDMAIFEPLRDNDVTGGVTVNLAAGIVTGVSTGTDTLRSMEFVRATSFDDVYDATNFGAAGFLDPLTNNVGSTGTFNAFEGMDGDDVVIGNGNTRVSYSNAMDGVFVDLAAPTAGQPGSSGTAYGIAMGDLAEVGVDIFFSGVIQAGGSDFDDQLYGGGASETFVGLAGNDWMDGRGGTFDTASYGANSTITAGVTIDMAAGIVTGDASVGTDTLRQIEAATGSNFVDTYVATGFGSVGALNVGNNGMINRFQGLGGNDIITGNGATEIAYFVATAGVAVDLALGTATGDASVGTDTFSGVSRAQGSNFDDWIRGDGIGNFLGGRDGNDTLIGGGGNDVLSGGNGADTFVYESGADFVQDFNRAQGDKIDLTMMPGVYSLADVLALASNDPSVLITFSPGNTLTLSGVTKASLVASDFLFAITGDDNDNTLVGTAGNDVIRGLDGEDVLAGLAGDDVLDGGDDRDLATYVGATGAVSVDMAAGTVSGDASVGNDTLVSVENVRGSAFADTYGAIGYAGNTNFPGPSTSNSFEGMGGDDAITGNGSTQVSYESATAGVTVDMAAPGVQPGSTGTASGTDAGDLAGVGTDTFFGGLNRVRGSAYDDTIYGSAGFELVPGRGG